MVGRVPLCVHGAGETKTGSVSSPGAEVGGTLFELFSYLGETTPKHPATSPQSCSQGAALKARRPTVSSQMKGSQGQGFGPMPVKP